MLGLVRVAALSIGLVAVAAVAPAVAAPNLVTNGSFETYSGGQFTGWTASGSLGQTPPQYAVQQPTDGTTAGMYGDVVAPDPFTASPDAAGTHAAYFVADSANQSLSQTIALVIGKTYEVGFDLYKNPSGAGNPNSFTITGSIGGTTVTAASSASLASGVWKHFAATFVAATTSATFAFNYVSGPSPAADVLADLVYVTAVPEPASLALLGIGAAAFFAVRRRRSAV